MSLWLRQRLGLRLWHRLQLRVASAKAQALGPHRAAGEPLAPAAGLGSDPSTAARVSQTTAQALATRDSFSCNFSIAMHTVVQDSNKPFSIDALVINPVP